MVQTYHAGMELFDGTTLVDAWERRWPDGSTTLVHDTLPTLSELRNHVADTGRDELTWDDVSNLRNRDIHGDVIAGNSGSPLLLDMNPLFDAAHLASTQEVGNVPGDTVAARVTSAVITLNDNVEATIVGMPRYAEINAGRATGGDVFSQSSDGLLNLHLDEDLAIATGPTTFITIPAGNYGGANALVLWVDFSSFAIMSPPPPVGSTDPDIHGAVSEILMASVGDHYIAGDGRVNENFGLTSIHHVFHEEHNYQVENLKTWIYAHDSNNPGATDPHEQLHNWQVFQTTQDSAGNYTYGVDGPIAWDEDKMFNGTKLIVEMEYQHAAVDQYARTITPRIQEFVGYSTGVDSTISLEYAQVAFRFGHSTIRETIDTIDPSGWMMGHVTRYALEKAFLNPQGYADEGVAAITLGLSRQQMNEVDEFITPALNQGLLGQPLDLAAINIARARDMGIPTLNDFREGISLARYTSWDDFGKNMIHPESLVNFIAAYSFGGDVAKAEAILGLFDGSISETIPLVTGTPPNEVTTLVSNPDALGFTAADALAFMLNNSVTGTNATELNTARDGFNHIDSWIGGLAEAHVPGGLLGETFDAIFVAQIQSLMDGDRFYYLYRLFGTQIHEEVNNGQFKDIVERNTGLSHLNGSIFAYADKYYDFNREADGTEFTAQDISPVMLDENGDPLLDDIGVQIPNPDYHITPTGDHADHLYADLLTGSNTKGIYSDGGASTDPNGSNISVTGSDGIRIDAPLNLIRDVRVDAQPDLVHPLEGTPTDGADSHEVIVATENVDYIHARGGDDTVYGEGGDDYIFGDGGIDRLYGGDGNDMLDSGEGPDLVDGGAGKDIIYGRGSGSEVGGFDQLVGGSGNDLIIGGEGIDKLSGGSGDDIIYGDGLTNPEMGNTDAFTHGGDGNDYIDTGASGDLLFGEEGDDYMVGGIDQDLMQGGQGDDILRPGGPSQASGTNGGPDEVVGDNGVANTSFDLIDLSDWAGNAQGAVIDFSTQTNPLVAIDQTSPFPAWFQIEGAIGTSNGDTFIGDSSNAGGANVTIANQTDGNNWLIGGSGNDTFTGAGGNDVIVGGSIRLDALIGKYDDAGAEESIVLGSTSWLADAMDTAAGGSGYDNNEENAYTGASNRTADADGLTAGGLLAAANLLLDPLGLTKAFNKHFTEMLESRMFKDLMLGDGGADGTANTVNFSGTASEYALTQVGTTGLLVVDNSTSVRDGTDLLVGIDNLQFATSSLSRSENTTAVVHVATPVGFVASSYSLSGADAALFTVTGTGELQFIAGPDFEAPTDASANNVYNVVVTASNGAGLSIVQDYAVTITDVDEAPSFTTANAFAIDENTTSITIVAALDPEGMAVTYGLAGPNAALFAINPVTGEISFLNPPDYEASPAPDNVVNVTVTATDGVNTANQTLAITVNNVNEPPTITSLAAVSVAENTTAVATVTGVDPDGPASFTYAVGGVDASLFSINPLTGALTFINAPNFEAPTDAGGDNSYNVDVSINDGSTTVTQSMTVTVINMNEAPIGVPTISDITPTEGSPITVSAAAITDPDGPPVLTFTYQWQSSSDGTNWTNISGATTASFTPVDLPNTLLASPYGPQASLQLRAVVSYTDAGGNVTSVNSAATSPTGVNWNAVTLFAPNFTGTAGDDIATGGLGNNALNGNAGDDVLSYNVTTFFGGVTSGRDFIDGGSNAAGGDRFVLNGTTGAEAFRIYARAAFLAVNPTANLNSNTEIVVTRNGTNASSIVAELDNIEEITINTLDVSVNDGNGVPNSGATGADTVFVIGNFNSPFTSLNFSTITVYGSNAGDTVDISQLTSDHRIVFNNSAGGGHVIGSLRPQDVVSAGVTVIEATSNPGSGDGIGSGSGSGSDSTDDTNLEDDSADPVVNAGGGSGSGSGSSSGSTDNGNSSGSGSGSSNSGTGSGSEDPVVNAGGGSGSGSGSSSGSTDNGNSSGNGSGSSNSGTGSGSEDPVVNAGGGSGSGSGSSSGSTDNGNSSGAGSSNSGGTGSGSEAPVVNAGGGSGSIGNGNGNSAGNGSGSGASGGGTSNGSTPPVVKPTHLSGDKHDNILRGHDGENVLHGKGGHDRIWGGADSDDVYGEKGNDQLWTGGGDDRAHGGAGSDRMKLGSGNDEAWGNRGKDTVHGGAGNDTFHATARDGADTYYGGNAKADSGDDMLDMSAILTRIEANLGSGSNFKGHAITEGVKDVLYGIENIVTGSGDDVIHASVAHNTMGGGDGKDTFVFKSAAHADGDTIQDFQAGDRIDVSSFMGDTVQLVNGPASAGQISVSFEEIDGQQVTVLQGNTDGDPDSEFTLHINGHHNLNGSSFA